jgi:hypothetical protein
MSSVFDIVKPVQGSTRISGMGYDPMARRLVLTFHSSQAAYVYEDVPAEVHQSLVEAESIGKAFGALVSGKFSFEKHERDAKRES